MKNKLKLVLWGKHLQLPEDYDDLEIDSYSLFRNSLLDSNYELIIYLNNGTTTEIYYRENGNKSREYTLESNGYRFIRDYAWEKNGKLQYVSNY